METRLTIHYGKEEKTVSCIKGDRLIDVIVRAGFPMDAACGGKGTCGKCKVIVEGGEFGEILPEERRFLSDEEISCGIRLACFARVFDDGKVRVPEQAGGFIRTAGLLRKVVPQPVYRRTFLELPQPSLTDQRSDFRRFLDGLKSDVKLPLSVLQTLSGVMQAGNYRVTAVSGNSQVLKVLPDDRCLKQYAAAVDIGTTTVVAYLIDLQAGKIVETASGLNQQKAFGADVISRIQYTMERNSGLSELTQAIRGQLNRLLTELLVKTGVHPDEIDYATIAGNTVMLHLLAGVPAETIARSPFQPVFLETQYLSSAELGISAFDGGIVLLPGISGYVGSDIAAGLAAVSLAQKDKPCLLVDIGTNGEMVLGCRDFMVACSTAAGPAFEGAHIRCGMGGAAGAVNSVSMEAGVVKVNTIQGEEPCGICGSGLLDAVASMLKEGIIDETGRMLDEEEFPEEYRSYACEIEDEPAFCLARRVGKSDLVLTQKDVRQVQLAKAAIAAGIRTLLKEAEIQAEDIDEVYLAGGFGSYLNPDSAVIVGLLPKVFSGRIQAVGNTAGTGAVIAALSDKELGEIESAVQTVRYVELSSSSVFQEAYMEQMLFETE